MTSEGSHISTKLNEATDILVQEGPIELARRGTTFVLKNTQFGKETRLNVSKRQVRRRIERESDLSDVLDTVLDIQPGVPPHHVRAMQLRDELREVTERVAETDPEIVLEIGTARGGTLYTWARSFDSAEALISIDLPSGEFGGGYDERSARLYRTFSRDAEMFFVRQNSHDRETYEHVRDDVIRDQLDDEPVDFLFIDGDHTYEGAKRDFEMYRDLVADGGIIGLHDIVHHPAEEAVVEQRREAVDDIEDRHLNWHENYSKCNVDRLWDEITDEYETEEIISHEKQTYAGIGLVYV